MPKPITDLLSQINAELKSRLCGVAVCIRGERLSLRGTFPPKPNSTKTKPHQQYLACESENPGIFGFSNRGTRRIFATFRYRDSDNAHVTVPPHIGHPNSNKFLDQIL